MDRTFLVVPSSAPIDMALAYAIACHRWRVEYAENRQQADGIQWRGDYGATHSATWAALPPPVADLDPGARDG